MFNRIVGDSPSSSDYKLCSGRRHRVVDGAFATFKTHPVNNVALQSAMPLSETTKYSVTEQFTHRFVREVEAGLQLQTTRFSN
jgi:hypothetical protein